MGQSADLGDARLFQPGEYLPTGQSADLGDAHCPDGEQELPGLEDEVHGGPDAAVATLIASRLEEGLSSA
jgi:hypothetical protein